MGCMCACSKRRAKYQDDMSPERIRKVPVSLMYRLGPTISRNDSWSLVHAEFLATRKDVFLVVIGKDKEQGLQRQKLFTHIERTNKLDHPYILKTYELVQDDSYFYLALEPFAGGQLAEYLYDHRFRSEAFVAKLMKKVFTALDYCSQRGIIHGNLCLESLVLTEVPESSSPRLKLTGFGEFDYFPSETTDLPEKSKFQAPEAGSGNKTDIWSCGAVLCFLLTGKMPTIDDGRSDAKKDASFVLLPTELKKFSGELQDLLSGMLHSDPLQRFSPSQCRKHRWVQVYVSSPSPRLSVLNSYLGSVKTAKVRSPLQQAVAVFTLYRVLSEKEVDSLTDFFIALDKDGDGVLREDEIRLVFSRLMGPENAAAAAANILKVAQSSPAGALTYTEFLLCALSEKQLHYTPHLQSVFTSCDLYHTGRVSLSHIRAYFGLDGGEKERHWKAVLAFAGRGQDESIDFAEFANLVTNFHSS